MNSLSMPDYPQFPRSAKYHPNWITAGVSGGANPLLEHGLSTETVICWQNAVVLLAWLALAMTLLALAHRVLTFLGRDKQPAA